MPIIFMIKNWFTFNEETGDGGASEESHMLLIRVNSVNSAVGKTFSSKGLLSLLTVPDVQ